MRRNIRSERDLYNWLFEQEEAGGDKGAAAAPDPLTAEKIQKLWQMPYTQFVEELKKVATDPKLHAFLAVGKKDGDPTDESVKVAPMTIAGSQLSPTQSEIDLSNSVAFSFKNPALIAKFYGGGAWKGGDPIITAGGKWVIDGHHRWSQAYLANPKVKVPVYDMTASITPQQALKATHIAIAADLGKLPLSPAKGINLYAAKELDIQRAVKINLTEQARKLYEEHGHGKTSEEISAYLWKNVQLMQTKNKPISGAPPRTSMPQTGDSQDYDTLLTKGIINFKNPKKDDVKTESRIKLKGLIR